MRNLLPEQNYKIPNAESYKNNAPGNNNINVLINIHF